MSGKLLLILLSLLLTGCDAYVSSQSVPTATGEPNGAAMNPMPESTTEFKRLRSLKGHFEGGTWNDDLDRWMGRKHQLMIQLGTGLGTGDYSQAQLVEWLGPPDLIIRQGDDLFELLSNLPDFEKPAPGSYEFLAYYWRGQHDFLYFVSQDETVVSSGWWYAGE